MKYTKNALTVLTRQYKSVLLKCALINAGLFLALATPAMADTTGVWETGAAAVDSFMDNLAGTTSWDRQDGNVTGWGVDQALEQLKPAMQATDQAIADVATLKTKVETLENEKIDKDSVYTKTQADTTFGSKTNVTANTTAIATLNGDADVAGSVANKIDTAITGLNLAGTYGAKDDVTANTTAIADNNGNVAYSTTDGWNIKAGSVGMEKLSDDVNAILTKASGVKITGVKFTDDNGNVTDVSKDLQFISDGSGNKVLVYTQEGVVNYVNQNNLQVNQTIDNVALREREITDGKIATALTDYTKTNDLGALAKKDTVAKSDLAADVQAALDKASGVKITGVKFTDDNGNVTDVSRDLNFISDGSGNKVLVYTQEGVVNYVAAAINKNNEEAVNATVDAVALREREITDGKIATALTDYTKSDDLGALATKDTVAKSDLAADVQAALDKASGVKISGVKFTDDNGNVTDVSKDLNFISDGSGNKVLVYTQEGVVNYVNQNNLQVNQTIDAVALRERGITDEKIAAALANGENAYQTESEVADTVKTEAANATYSDDGQGNVVTIADAIAANASAVGDVKTLLESETGNLTNGGKTDPVDVVTAVENMDKTLGQIHGLAATLETKGTYNGNLASGTTVEDHLTALDAAIGNKANVTTGDTSVFDDTPTSVYGAIDTLGVTAKTNADAIAANAAAIANDSGAVSYNATDGWTIGEKAVDKSNLSEAVQATLDKAAGVRIAGVKYNGEVVDDLKFIFDGTKDAEGNANKVLVYTQEGVVNYVNQNNLEINKTIDNVALRERAIISDHLGYNINEANGLATALADAENIDTTDTTVVSALKDLDAAISGNKNAIENTSGNVTYDATDGWNITAGTVGTEELSDDVNAILTKAKNVRISGVKFTDDNGNVTDVSRDLNFISDGSGNRVLVYTQEGVVNYVNQNNLEINKTIDNVALRERGIISAQLGYDVTTENGLGIALANADTYNFNTDETTLVSALTDLDSAIGDRAYDNTLGAAYEFGGMAMAARNTSATLTEAISQVASNIGTADELGEEKNGVSADNTVNANIAAVNSALGDVQSLAQTNYANSGSIIEAIKGVDSKLYKLDKSVTDLRHEFHRGMASMAAMSALVPNARANGSTQLSIGTGAYNGYTGFALGAFHWVNDNVLLNAGIGYSNSSDAVYRMGVTFSW